jgi:hypothetical protein
VKRPRKPEPDYTLRVQTLIEELSAVAAVLATDSRDAACRWAEEIADGYVEHLERVQGNRGDRLDVTWDDVRRYVVGVLRMIADRVDGVDAGDG